jgi:hypothetical protein
VSWARICLSLPWWMGGWLRYFELSRGVGHCVEQRRGNGLEMCSEDGCKVWCSLGCGVNTEVAFSVVGLGSADRGHSLDHRPPKYSPSSASRARIEITTHTTTQTQLDSEGSEPVQLLKCSRHASGARSDQLRSKLHNVYANNESHCHETRYRIR